MGLGRFGMEVRAGLSREKRDPFWLGLVWFGLVGFYGISTIVGYLMPNLLYAYILNIYDLVCLQNPLYTYILNT